jgi:PadR family transcriptional regulator, regulatory protein AphA
MSLEHAILGFLKDRPRTGYDLKTVFDMTVSHFWPADQSQIYRTLSRLTENGWIETEVIKQDQRLDRKIYHITPEGSEELLRWLSTPVSAKAVRLPKMIQIFFAGYLPEDEKLKCFERFVEFYRRSIAGLRALPEKGYAYRRKNPPLPDKDIYFRMLPLEYGLRLAETSLRWGEEVVDRLKRGDHVKYRLEKDPHDKQKPTKGVAAPHKKGRLKTTPKGMRVKSGKL